MNDHIAKPVNPDFLYDVLLKWLPDPGPDSAEGGPASSTVAEQDGWDTLNERLQNIPGLDAASGLRAMRGRVDAYCRLLHRHTDNHLEDCRLLREKLEASEVKEAQDLVHALKGASATLGLSGVATAATQLELALKHRLPNPMLTQLADKVDTEMRLMASAIRTLSCEHLLPEEMTHIDGSKTDEELDRLKGMLVQGNFEVLEFMRQHRTMLLEQLGNSATNLMHQIDNFDYEAALITLQKVRNGLY